MSGLERAFNIEDLRRMARRRLPRAVFDFFDGGAEDELSLRENRAAFERVRLLPRVMVDVRQVDTGIELFDIRANLPMAIAPTGAIAAGRFGADLMLARAARAAAGRAGARGSAGGDRPDGARHVRLGDAGHDAQADRAS